MSEQTNGATEAKRRGRPPGQTNLDSFYLVWKRAHDLATDPTAQVEAEVERYRQVLMKNVTQKTELAKVDAASALAKFKIYGGKVNRQGEPVNEDGTPYVTTSERKAQTETK